MNNIQITKNAIEYLSDMCKIDEEEAEEHIITVLSMCRMSSGAGDANKVLEAARGLVEYRRQAGPLNFQLEKADDFINRMKNALDEMGVGEEKGSKTP